MKLRHIFILLFLFSITACNTSGDENSEEQTEEQIAQEEDLADEDMGEDPLNNLYGAWNQNDGQLTIVLSEEGTFTMKELKILTHGSYEMETENSFKVISDGTPDGQIWTFSDLTASSVTIAMGDNEPMTFSKAEE